MRENVNLLVESYGTSENESALRRVLETAVESWYVERKPWQ